MDAHALPFDDGSFDAVVANFLVAPRPAGTRRRRVARVLAPGGRLALTAWDLPERRRASSGSSWTRWRPSGASPPAEIPQGRGSSSASRASEDFAALLRDAGLDAIEVQPIAFDAPGLLRRRALGRPARGPVRMSALSARPAGRTRRRIREAFDGLGQDCARKGTRWSSRSRSSSPQARPRQSVQVRQRPALRGLPARSSRPLRSAPDGAGSTSVSFSPQLSIIGRVGIAQ